eukprot:gene5794-7993_t
MSEDNKTSIRYQDGFGSYFSSESLPNSLPQGQNNPQCPPQGLYAEQLSGSSFTAPRYHNMRSWLYKIRPSVQQSPYVSFHASNKILDEFNHLEIEPNQLRWSPRTHATSSQSIESKINFVDGLSLVCGAGDPALKVGLSIYNYLFNSSMNHQAIQNSDGDFLIVPQEGKLLIKTEFGRFEVEPCEIIVIPRGIKFSINQANDNNDNIFSRGYVLETFKGHFELPSLGPIGSNGLANPRDFLAPVAWFENIDYINNSSNNNIDNINNGDHIIENAMNGKNFVLYNKYMNKLFVTNLSHSPFDVVAWHGNYYPYKYDLRKFCVINTVSFDHPDPSIFTVLTCPSDEPGTAIADFVIFPPRWMVAEHTFRPPYFHRNCMSEYMGMIYGKYDAKEVDSKGQGFVPGGASLHSVMTPHGPDVGAFQKGSNSNTNKNPIYFDEGLAFMFESCLMLKVSPSELQSTTRQNQTNSFPYSFK